MKRLICLSALALILAACRTPTSSEASKPDSKIETSSAKVETGEAINSKDPKISLPLRSVARWQNLIDRKPEASYDFLSPGYRVNREREDYARRMSARPVKWTAVSYVDQDCASEDSCMVKVTIDYSVNIPRTGEVNSQDTLIEQWILSSDGRWYYLPDDGH